MERGKREFINQVVMICDIVITVFSFIISYYIRNVLFTNYAALYPLPQYIWILFVIVPVHYICFNYFGLYSSKNNQSIGKMCTSLIKSIAFSNLISSTTIYFVKIENFSRLYMGTFIVVNFFILFIQKIILRYVFTFTRKNRVIIVGEPRLARRFALELTGYDATSDILGYVSLDSNCSKTKKSFNAKREHCLGNIEKLLDIVIRNAADEVVFALPKSYVLDVEPYILQCEEIGVTTRLLLDIYNVKLSKTNLSYVGSLPVLTFHTVSLNFAQLFLKRATDIIGSIIGLAFTLVAAVILFPIIKIDSPGRLFFAQKRMGRNGRIFNCYKFRSMYEGADSKKKELYAQNEMNGAVFKLKDDPRITRVGEIIRKLSIDELPQFWNVFVGQMSLVGTRPPTLDEVKNYANYHRRRLSIKPGITGMWQVSGRNTITDFERIVQLDFEYIDNWTIFLDFKIIIKTIVVLITRKGAQ